MLLQVGRVLCDHFEGEVSNLIRSAQGSAAKLVDLVAQHFPGFRDHGVYKGQQVRSVPRTGSNAAIRCSAPPRVIMTPLCPGVLPGVSLQACSNMGGRCVGRLWRTRPGGLS